MTSWWEPLTAIGTMLAALAAAWAALVSSRASRSAAEMAGLEADRRGEELTRPARQVLIDVMSRDYVDDNGFHDGTDVQVQVTNAGPSPVYSARLRVQVDDLVWGPQVIGSLPGSDSYVLTARFETTVAPERIRASLRFSDPYDVAWIATPGGRPTRAADTVDEWIAESAQFAQRELTHLERGYSHSERRADLWDEWFEYARRVAQVEERGDDDGQCSS